MYIEPGVRNTNWLLRISRTGAGWQDLTHPASLPAGRSTCSFTTYLPDLSKRLRSATPPSKLHHSAFLLAAHVQIYPHLPSVCFALPGWPPFLFWRAGFHLVPERRGWRGVQIICLQRPVWVREPIHDAVAHRREASARVPGRRGLFDLSLLAAADDWTQASDKPMFQGYRPSTTSPAHSAQLMQV